VAIVQHVNSRDQHVAILALTVMSLVMWLTMQLLDICVKNCGYPFHLQIATKDFLNEFVRRFPERPPPRPSRAQRRILEMIEEWRATIVHAARDPKDFAHIRDMHRLLRMKGIPIFMCLTKDMCFHR
jgi:ADP-ribosylation factor-binding protein GGA